MEETIGDKSKDFGDIKKLSQSVMKNLLACTKAANKLPTEEDYEYYETFKGFRSVNMKAQKNVLSILTSLMRGNAIKEHFAELDVDEQFDMIKNINSNIFENISAQIAESSGKKAEENELISVTNSAVEINTSWNKMDFLNKKINDVAISLLSAKNISRPQLKFKTKVDNTNSAFVPIIKEKPNSIKPLAIMLEKSEDSEEFCHPYECELEKFQPSDDQLQSCTPVPPTPLAETPMIMVDTEESLASLCNLLKEVKEFAIDVEHHSYRTFQGFSCLIQISTRKKDFIIDAIALRSELWILNEVFTDPKITKVFHGADMDVIWLQRDFGIYVVNMFDTGQAARVLSFPHLSLVYLLKHYCKINMDKRYQLADWRMRPLPTELLKYAREDTHYLLYVYDCMRNDLIDKGNKNYNLLLSVYQRSKDVCLKRYEKLLLTEDSYMELYKKSRKNLNVQQLYCLKELYEWRDKIARVEDESYAYVLPNHMLLQIAEVLPRDHQGILACCNPVPPLVRQQLNELHIMISKASLLTIAQLQEKIEMPLSLADDPIVDLNNILHCPHDIHLYQGRTEHEIHLSGNRLDLCASDVAAVKIPLKKKPCLLLGKTALKKSESSSKVVEDVTSEIGGNFRTTYERFLLTKQHFTSQAEESKNIEPQTNPSKESDEKSFIEVMNPALKAAFASNKKANKKSSSDPYHYVASTSMDQSSQEIIFESPASTPSSSTVVIDLDSTIDSPSSKERKESTKRPNPSPVKTIKKEADDSQKKSKLMNVEAESFQPFDYGKTSFNELHQSSTSQRQKKSSFNPSVGRSNFKDVRNTPINKKARKRQGTFPGHSDSVEKRKWPKS